MVKWSACKPPTPMIRVRTLLTPTVFCVKFVFEKNKNKQKEAEVGPFFKKEFNFATRGFLIRGNISEEFIIFLCLTTYVCFLVVLCSGEQNVN